MSMNEERNLFELPAARPASFKVALGIAGFVVGLGLLFCGGVAAYVAWKGPSGKASELDTSPLSDDSEILADPSKIERAAGRIVQIDLPPGFEPLKREISPPMTSVTFGRRSGEGGLLLIGKVLISAIPSDSGLEMQREMMLSKLASADERGRTALRDTNPTGTKHEMTVLGQRVEFEITRGVLQASSVPAVKVSGWFSSKTARMALIYAISEEEYDEEAVARMIASIRIPEGDSAPPANVSKEASPADASGDSRNEPAQPMPADDDRRDGSQKTRTDGE